MANYGIKQFSKYRQILCKVEEGKLPQCEQDIEDTIREWEKDISFYNSDISDYQKGIIDFWGTSNELCDDDRGLAYLKAEADSGNPEAMNLCAMAYYLISKQNIQEEADKEKYQNNAIEYWKLGVENGQAEAMSNLALCYLEGIFVEQDLAQAKELFKLAAKAKHPKAKEYMKAAKLDKWKPGKEYDETPLTTMEALRNANPKPKKKSLQEKIGDSIGEAVVKAKRISIKEAIKLFQEKYPDYIVVECEDCEHMVVVGVLPRSLNAGAIKDYYPEHFKIGKIDKVIAECSVLEALDAENTKSVRVEKYLSEEDNEFRKTYKKSIGEAE